MDTRTPEEFADVISKLLVRVYEIHEYVLRDGGGGIEGFRDTAMLHAAVARPFVTFENIEIYASPFEKAAALLHSLIKSHPFMDGTKRTAFLSALYLLGINGQVPRRPLPMDEVVQFCVDLAEEEERRGQGEVVVPKTVDEIAAWLKGLVA